MKNKLDIAFENYIKNYDMNEKQIRYKYHHSYRVKALMSRLATYLNLNDKEKEVAEVIGLLHDIGRFEQITIYGNCSDIKAGIDHADESCIYLFDEGHIRDFYNDENYYDIIKAAIKNHNKYKIEDNLNEESMLFSKMIRDMDKVDIYKVLTDEYSYIFDKNEISKGVLDSFYDDKTILNSARKTSTDNIYGYFAFVYDINFKPSFQILKNGKYIENICNVIYPKEDSINQFNELKNKVLKYIDEKIETN